MAQQYATSAEQNQGTISQGEGHYGGAGTQAGPIQQSQPTQQPAQMGQQPAQSRGGAPPTQMPQGTEMGPQAAAGADMKLEEALTDEMRVALHDFVQSATACEWCADRCIDEGPGMEECIRLCRDVADLATLNVQLISRDSVFGPEAAEVFADAAEACAQECSRHPHRHCQECAEVLSRAAQSTRKMLASFGGPAAGMQAGGPQFQQSVGQQF